MDHGHCVDQHTVIFQHYSIVISHHQPLGGHLQFIEVRENKIHLQVHFCLVSF
jgi:hypothetical protein